MRFTREFQRSLPVMSFKVGGRIKFLRVAICIFGDQMQYLY